MEMTAFGKDSARKSMSAIALVICIIAVIVIII